MISQAQKLRRRWANSKKSLSDSCRDLSQIGHGSTRPCDSPSPYGILKHTNPSTYKRLSTQSSGKVSSISDKSKDDSHVPGKRHIHYTSTSKGSSSNFSSIRTASESLSVDSEMLYGIQDPTKRDSIRSGTRTPFRELNSAYGSEYYGDRRTSRTKDWSNDVSRFRRSLAKSSIDRMISVEEADYRNRLEERIKRYKGLRRSSSAEKLSGEGVFSFSQRSIQNLQNRDPKFSLGEKRSFEWCSECQKCIKDQCHSRSKIKSATPMSSCQISEAFAPLIVKECLNNAGYKPDDHIVLKRQNDKPKKVSADMTPTTKLKRQLSHDSLCAEINSMNKSKSGEGSDTESINATQPDVKVRRRSSFDRDELKSHLKELPKIKPRYASKPGIFKGMYNSFSTTNKLRLVHQLSLDESRSDVYTELAALAPAATLNSAPPLPYMADMSHYMTADVKREVFRTWGNYSAPDPAENYPELNKSTHHSVSFCLDLALKPATLLPCDIKKDQLVTNAQTNSPQEAVSESTNYSTMSDQLVTNAQTNSPQEAVSESTNYSTMSDNLVTPVLVDSIQESLDAKSTAKLVSDPLVTPVFYTAYKNLWMIK